jgi:hypothetical protein
MYKGPQFNLWSYILCQITEGFSILSQCLKGKEATFISGVSLYLSLFSSSSPTISSLYQNPFYLCSVTKTIVQENYSSP